MFAYVDRMPQFDVPEGENQESWLRKEVLTGLEMRYGTPIPAHVMERYETEMTVIGPMGFSSYFLIVADICKYARDNGIPVGPGRGSATGSIIAYATRITELDPLEHGLLFERFLNPERINPPDVDLDFDDRQRDRMVRYVTDKYGAAYTAQVNTFGTIKAKAAVKDSSRVLGYPFGMGDRITKAMPPDVMGKGVPLYALHDETHPRYAEGGEIRALYDSDPDVKKIMDTGLGIEGLIRGTGVHAAAVILSSAPLLDLIPLHRRDKDGVIITGFDYPSCENMGLMKMDFLGLRNLGIIDHAIEVIKLNRGIEITTEKIPLDDATTYELLARGDTLGVFQLDGGPMRQLLRLMEPSRFEDIAAVLALYRPGPMAANAHTNYAHRKNGRQEISPIHPELEEALEPILGNTFHLLVYQEQIMAIARELAGYTLGGADLLAPGDGQEEEGDPRQGVRQLPEGHARQRLQRRRDQGALGRHAAVLRVRVQQVAHRRLRAGVLLDGVPQGELPGRVRRGAADLGRRRQGQDGRLPGRRPGRRDQGAAAGRQRVARPVRRRRHRHPVRHGRRAQRRHQRGRRDRAGPQREGRLHRLLRLPAQGRRGRLQQASDRIADQGRRVRLADAHPRRGLLAVHADAVESFVDVKKNEAIGQFDLFGGAFGDDGRRSR